MRTTMLTVILLFQIMMIPGWSLTANQVKELYKQGTTIAKQGQYELAITYFDKVLESDPANCNALYNRGLCKQRLKNSTDAIEDFTYFLDLQPNNHRVLNSRGKAFLNSGQVKNAVEDFIRATKLDETNGEYFDNLADAYRSTGQLDECLASHLTAIRLAPEEAWFHFNYGISCSLAEKWQQAYTAFDKVIQLKPKNGEAYFHRGIAASRLKKFKNSRQDLRQARKLAPQYVQEQDRLMNNSAKVVKKEQKTTNIKMVNRQTRDQLYSHAIDLAEVQRYAEAVDCLTRVIDNFPDYTPASFNRAVCFYKLGLVAKAEQEFDRLLTQYPNHVDTLYYRGCVRLNSKKSQGALADFTKALELAPHRSDIRELRDSVLPKGKENYFSQKPLKKGSFPVAKKIRYKQSKKIKTVTFTLD